MDQRKQVCLRSKCDLHACKRTLWAVVKHMHPLVVSSTPALFLQIGLAIFPAVFPVPLVAVTAISIGSGALLVWPEYVPEAQPPPAVVAVESQLLRKNQERKLEKVNFSAHDFDHQTKQYKLHDIRSRAKDEGESLT